MGRLGNVLKAVFSLVVSILTILFLYGYLTPLGLSPSAILGPSYAGLFGGTLAGTNGSILTGTYTPLIPGGVAGLIIFTVLRRMGSVTRAATAPSAPSAEEMMRRMNFPGMMGGMAGAQAAVPESLPADITKPQFAVLGSYRQGYKNPKEVSKALSMDKKEVEGMTSTLVSNGYLTKDNKLTGKALEILT